MKKHTATHQDHQKRIIEFILKRKLTFKNTYYSLDQVYILNKGKIF